jgi:rRNA maturation endonuclease Nob1
MSKTVKTIIGPRRNSLKGYTYTITKSKTSNLECARCGRLDEKGDGNNDTCPDCGYNGDN